MSAVQLEILFNWHSPHCFSSTSCGTPFQLPSSVVAQPPTEEAPPRETVWIRSNLPTILRVFLVVDFHRMAKNIIHGEWNTKELKSWMTHDAKRHHTHSERGIPCIRWASHWQCHSFLSVGEPAEEEQVNMRGIQRWLVLLRSILQPSVFSSHRAQWL